MYGLIGKINAIENRGSELADILIEGSRNLAGCISYIVSMDHNNPDSLWISEVWDTRESHDNSLIQKDVQDAIQKAKPIIAGFGERFETIPVGGTGIINKI